MIRSILIITCLLVSRSISAAPSLDTIHHDIQIRLDPENGELEATDRLNLPEPVKTLTLLLHGDLTLDQSKPNATVDSRPIKSWVTLKQYTLQFKQPTQTLTLKYRGRISHALQASTRDYARGRDTTPGLISPKGVFLSAGSFWYPQIEGRLVNFTLNVAVPQGWHSISQGTEISTNTWQEKLPQDDIYLIAAPFHIYSRESAGIKAQVFLRNKDNDLAERYLSATTEYLQLYSELLGDYPYKKFCSGGEFLGERLRHALLYPTWPTGDSSAVYYPYLLSPRDTT